MTSSSAEYYRTHPAARARKAAYDTKFESSPAQKVNRGSKTDMAGDRIARGGR